MAFSLCLSITEFTLQDVQALFNDVAVHGWPWVQEQGCSSAHGLSECKEELISRVSSHLGLHYHKGRALSNCLNLSIISFELKMPSNSSDYLFQICVHLLEANP